MKKVILSLGGSLIIPDTVRTVFLRQFRNLILSKVEEGYEFVIFAGGGSTARIYQQGLEDIMGEDASNDAKDWVGIYSSWVNARLVLEMFREHAREEIIIDPTVPVQTDKPIVIGGGWKPGWSTDYDAVQVAVNNGYDKVINLSNITYVYDKDPNKFDDAVKITDIAWPAFRKIVGDEWTPGLSMPFDPIASKVAEEHGIEVIVANGQNVENVQAILEGDEFIGTRIHAA